MESKTSPSKRRVFSRKKRTDAASVGSPSRTPGRGSSSASAAARSALSPSPPTTPSGTSKSKSGFRQLLSRNRSTQSENSNGSSRASKSSRNSQGLPTPKKLLRGFAARLAGNGSTNNAVASADDRSDVNNNNSSNNNNDGSQPSSTLSSVEREHSVPFRAVHISNADRDADCQSSFNSLLSATAGASVPVDPDVKLNEPPDAVDETSASDQHRHTRNASAEAPQLPPTPSSVPIASNATATDAVSTLLSTDDKDPEQKLEVASLYCAKGRELWSAGNKNDALEHFQAALRLLQNVLGRNHVLTAKTYYWIGFIRKHQRKWDLALANFRKTLQIRLRLLGKDHVSTQEAKTAVTWILTERKLSQTQVDDYHQALAQSAHLQLQADKALATLGNIDGTNKSTASNSTANNSSTGQDMLRGIAKKTVSYLEQSIQLEREASGTLPTDIAELEQKLAQARNHLAGLSQSLQEDGAIDGSGDNRHDSDSIESALLCRSALKTYIQELGPSHPTVTACVKQFCELLPATPPPDASPAFTVLRQDYAQRSCIESVRHELQADSHKDNQRWLLAVQSYARCLAIEVKILGKSHPIVRLIQSQLSQCQQQDRLEGKENGSPAGQQHTTALQSPPRTDRSSLNVPPPSPRPHKMSKEDLLESLQQYQATCREQEQQLERLQRDYDFLQTDKALLDRQKQDLANEVSKYQQQLRRSVSPSAVSSRPSSSSYGTDESRPAKNGVGNVETSHVDDLEQLQRDYQLQISGYEARQRESLEFIKRLQKQLEHARKTDPENALQDRCKALQDDLQQALLRQQSLQEELDGAMSRLRTAEESASDTSELMQSLTAERDKLLRSVQSLEEQISQIESSLKAFNDTVLALKLRNNNLQQQLEADRSSLEGQIERANSKTAELEGQVVQLETALLEATTELNKLQKSKADQVGALTESLQKVTEEKEEVQTQLEAVSMDLQSTRDEKSAWDDEKNSLQTVSDGRLQELQDAKTQIVQLRLELNHAKEEVTKQKAITVTTESSAGESVSKLQIKYDGALEQIRSLESKLADTQRNVELLNDEKTVSESDSRALVDELESLRGEKATLQEFLESIASASDRNDTVATFDVLASVKTLHEDNQRLQALLEIIAQKEESTALLLRKADTRILELLKEKEQTASLHTHVEKLESTVLKAEVGIRESVDEARSLRDQKKALSDQVEALEEDKTKNQSQLDRLQTELKLLSCEKTTALMRVAELEVAQAEWAGRDRAEVERLQALADRKSDAHAKQIQDMKDRIAFMENQHRAITEKLGDTEKRLAEATKQLQNATHKPAKDGQRDRNEDSDAPSEHPDSHDDDDERCQQVRSVPSEQSQGEVSQEARCIDDAMADPDSLGLNTSLTTATTMTMEESELLKSRNQRAAKVIKELSNELIGTKRSEKQAVKKYSQLRASVQSLQDQNQELKRAYQELRTKSQAKDEGISRKLAMLTKTIDTIRRQTSSPTKRIGRGSTWEADDGSSIRSTPVKRMAREADEVSRQLLLGDRKDRRDKSLTIVPAMDATQFVPNVFPTQVATYVVRVPNSNTRFTKADPLFSDLSQNPEFVYDARATLTNPKTMDILAKVADGSVLLITGTSRVVLLRQDGTQEVYDNFDEHPSPLGWVTHVMKSAKGVRGKEGQERLISLDEVYENAQMHRDHYCRSVLSAQSNPRFQYPIGISMKRLLAMVLYSSPGKERHDGIVLFLAVMFGVIALGLGMM